MSTKYPMDTPGIQALFASIYAKPSEEQATIREEVRTDLRSWLHGVLLLNSMQAHYLNNMSSESLATAGELLADAMEDQAQVRYMESTPSVVTAQNREPRGKEILMGMTTVTKIAPTEEEEDVFVVLIDYYG